MILTAMGISMVVPEFIPGRQLEALFAVHHRLHGLLYGLFLRMQTGQHSYFFATTTRCTANSTTATRWPRAAPASR
jgi:Ca2+:H+ antiporter